MTEALKNTILFDDFRTIFAFGCGVVKLTRAKYQFLHGFRRLLPVAAPVALRITKENNWFYKENLIIH